MRETLTDERIRKIGTPERGRIELVDAKVPGLALRISRNGAAWSVMLKGVGGKERIALGTWPKLGTDAARAAAWAARSARGQAGPDQLTVSALARLYLDTRKARLSPKTVAGDESFIARLGDFGAMNVHDVKRDHVRQLHARWSEDHGPVSANRIVSFISTVFAWGVAEEKCPRNPAFRFEGHVETGAHRELTDTEIQQAWKQEGDLGRFLRFLLLTGCRRTEAFSLRWKHVNGVGITIPAELRKGRADKRRTLVIPLNATIKATLGERGDDEALLFPDVAKNHQRLMERAALGFGFHDCRVTVATRIAALGFPPHVPSIVLGHSTQTTILAAGGSAVTALYVKDKFGKAHAEALNALAAHLRGIVA